MSRSLAKRSLALTLALGLSPLLHSGVFAAVTDYTADPTEGLCSNCCSSPLILDLDHSGHIMATGLAHSVTFDINGDGVKEVIGWTFWQSDEGFLWIDLNLNGEVDNGRELFGNATLLPGGQTARNGFEALGAFDSPSHGGDGDGWITPEDMIWPRLSLWIDKSHDAVSQPSEIFSLADYGVEAIGLEFTDDKDLDGAGNNHRLKGEFLRRVEAFGLLFARKQRIEDVFFVTDAP